MPGVMNPLQLSSIVPLIGTVLGKELGCLATPVNVLAVGPNFVMVMLLTIPLEVKVAKSLLLSQLPK